MKKKRKGPAPGTLYKNVTRTTLGTKIAAVRRRRGITQQQLAKRTGISKRMISYYERESENISAPLLQKITDALGITTDQLLNGKTDRKDLQTSRALLKRLETAKDLPEDKQKALMHLIDSMAS